MKIKFVNSATERIIIAISETDYYTSKIIRVIGMTQAHAVKIFHRLENENIVTKTKDGRRIKIELTDKGKQLQFHLKEIKRLTWLNLELENAKYVIKK